MRANTTPTCRSRRWTGRVERGEHADEIPLRLVTQEDFVAGKAYRSVQLIEAEQSACKGVQVVRGRSAFSVVTVVQIKEPRYAG